MRVLEQVGFEMILLRMLNAAPVEGGGPSRAKRDRLPRMFEALNGDLAMRRTMTSGRTELKSVAFHAMSGFGYAK